MLYIAELLLLLLILNLCGSKESIKILNIDGNFSQILYKTHLIVITTGIVLNDYGKKPSFKIPS